MDYQVIVVGAGPGGYVCALRLAQLGKSVAVIERSAIGGTCLNVGCVPTKTFLREVASGSSADRISARKEEVIASQQKGIAGLLEAAKITLIEGEATIVSGPAVQLADGSCLKAEAVVIASGSQPALPPISGIDLAGVITSDEVLGKDLPKPKQLAIIGGGVIGVELASFYAALGSQVTIIEALPRLLATMDREVGQSLALQLKKDGVNIVTGAMVKTINKEGDGLSVSYEAKNKTALVNADMVLIAVGRQAATAKLFADGLNPEMNKGALVVDERFETTISGVYAIGDVIGGLQLAHRASAQGKALAGILAGVTETIDLSLVPSCVYTQPEIAVVGMDAAQAKEQGIETISGKFLMGGNAKSVIDEQPRSFIKLIFRADDHRLIGGSLYCGRASDLISAVTLAIRAEMTAEALAETVFPHPTYGEGIGEAAEAALDKCVHMVKR